MTEIKSKGIDALTVCGTYTDGGLIVKQATELGLTVPVISGPGLYSPKFIEIAGKAAERSISLGAFVSTNPDPEKGRNPNISLISLLSDDL